MKRTIAVLLTIALFIGAFAGCGKKESDKKDTISWPNASGDSTFVGAVQNNSSQDNASSEKEDTPVSSPSSQGGSSTASPSEDSSSKNESSEPNDNSDVSDNNSSNEEPEENIVDISGDGITSNGVEKITSTNAVAAEFYLPGFQKLTYEYSESKKMCYSLRLPDGYNEQEKYPVLMFLHGINDCGSNGDTIAHLATLYQYNADIVNRAIVVSPQAISKDLWQMTGDGNGKIAYSLLTNVIEKDYSVDMNRIYLIGLSMGGIGTWGMIEEYPDHFAAASPICGMGTPMKANILKNIPIWCWHGTLDTTVNYNWDGATPKMYDAIKKAGGNKIIFTKLQNEGHNAWDPAFKSREHLSWLFSQVKGKHQSTDYSMIPYLTVRDSNGNVIISEKDAIDIEKRKGTGKVSGMMDLCLTLSKEATQKLSSAYQKSGGKEFKIYFGNKEIVSFKATQKTEGRVLVIRDVFTESSSSNYYSKLLTTVGKN